MKILLVITAAVEAATGLALVIAPNFVSVILLNSPLDTPAGLVVARITGAALLALATACWLARNVLQERAVLDLITAMLLYNTATSAILVYAVLGLNIAGFGLWPGVALHLVLAVWCIACLRRK